MKLHTTQSEGNLNELARRLFKIEGPGADDAEKKAVEALKRANPQLRGEGALPKEAPIVVPDVEGLKPASKAGANVNLPDDTAKQLKRSLDLVETTLAESQEKRISDEKNLLKDLER